jgi:hypothetical protein
MKSRPGPLWGRFFRRPSARYDHLAPRRCAAHAWMATLIVSLGLACPILLSAQTAGVGSLRGTIVDPSGGAVPNATVQATSATGEISKATTNATGAYQLNNLAVGAYTVDVTVAGFAPYKKENVAVVANRPLQLDISLEIAQQKEEVTVAGETLAVNTSPSNNAGAVVLTDKELDALPDDPDELQDDLEALAGPSAGPNGGQMYIDGFTAGQLPPKSSIREIRINQNPFSAEYDKPGFGRIEIFTKPGTNNWHGQVFVNENQAVLNSRNPFASSTGDFDSTQLNGNVGGPLSKKASLFFNADYRNIANESVVSADILGPTFSPTPFSALVPFPQWRLNIGPRLDYQLTKNNTLTVRYQYLRNNQTNSGVGGFILPEQGANVLGTEDQVQITDNQVIGSKVIYETRFQFLHQTNDNIAQNLLPSITVPGAFTGGGSGSAIDLQNHYELQNYASVSLSKNFIRFGIRVRDVADSNNSTSPFFGSFQFASLIPPPNTPVSATTSSYQIMEENLAAFTASQAGAAAVRAMGGGPSQFSITTGNPSTHVNMVDVGPFIEDDWRVLPNLTISYGLRFETQNHIADHADWAPRFGVAWGIGRGKATPKTVLRAGWGMFYDRFAETNILQAVRENGVTEQQYIVPDPTFFCTTLSACPSISQIAGMATSTPTIYQISPTLHAPYMLQTAVSVERQVTKSLQLSVTYMNSRGFDQLLLNNVNSPVLPGTFTPTSPCTATVTTNCGVYPNGISENIYQYQSDGNYKQNQVIFNAIVRRGSRVTLNGYYSLNYADSDTGGAPVGGGGGFGGGNAATPVSFPSNPYNLFADYGRATFDIRDRVFVGGTIRLVYGLSLAPFLTASSGVPYNITLGKDLIGSSVFNQRPGIVSSTSCSTTQVSSTTGYYCTPFGTFNPNPTPGEPLVPVNYLTGPKQFSLNLRLSKVFAFGKPPEGPIGRAGAGGGGGGGQVRPPRGVPGGGFNPGGGGAAPTGRYNLTASINARNVFNNVNFATPEGTITSPLFGQSNALSSQGQGGGTPAQNRQIFLQLIFSF